MLVSLRTALLVSITATALVVGAVSVAIGGHSDLPKAPKGSVMVDHHSRTGLVAADYKINGMSPAAVTKHYRKAFKARGFSVRSSRSSSGYSYLYMKNAGVFSFVGAGEGRRGEVHFEVCKGTDKLQVDVCG